jgi:peptide/nickel transport system ATP-binding protein
LKKVGKELVVAHNITKYYSEGQKAVDQVSLSINKGECLGIVGESGSGKSTLARCLLQLEKIDEGEVWLNGRILPKSSYHEKGSASRIPKSDCLFKSKIKNN